MLLNWSVGTLESSLDDSKEIQPVNPKGNQPWIFIGRTDAEAEALILCPPDLKNWLMEKTMMLEKLKEGGEWDDRGWDGWIASWLNGHEFEHASGVGDGQGSLACCSPWVHCEVDMTEWLNWTEQKWTFHWSD